jgi:putative DNA primase/helicase
MSIAFSLPQGATVNSNSLNAFFAIPAPPKVVGSGVGAGRSPLALLPASQADPAAVADLVISSLVFDGIQTLRFWCGSWWYWSAGRYTEFSSDDVRCVVTRVFSENYDSVRSRHVSDVIEHLKAKLLLNSSLSPPTWLGSSIDWQPADCLPTRDSVVHLPTLVGWNVGDITEPSGEVNVALTDSTAANQPYFVPATPLYFTTVATDFGFDPDASEPVRWLQFLDELWGDDEESINTLQELFGYALTADTRFQKIFCLIGPKRGGKGTIARVLRKLIGEGNVAGPTLSGLATQFGLENIIGKTLAIVSDMRLGQVDRAIVVERLLAISGEDKLTVDRKHKTAVHLQLPTKFLLISNELPRLDDASATIISRMIVLKTTASFYGNEDLELESDLRQELPGILLWAIEGWRRLQERGRFEQPESSQELIAEMKALASPISAFVEECCTTGANDSVPASELYQAYCRWCEDNGWERKSTLQRFGRDLRAVVPTLNTSRPANPEGSGSCGSLRPRCYSGIGLQPGA